MVSLESKQILKTTSPPLAEVSVESARNCRRVLFIAENSFQRHGGIQTHIRKLIENLGQDSTAYDFSTISSFELEKSYLLDRPYVRREIILQKIRESNPDIIHVHGFASLFLTSALDVATKFTPRVVFTPHSHPFETLRRPNLARFHYLLRQKRIINRCRHLVALTEQERTFFLNHGYRNQVHVIPNGFDLQDLEVSSEVKERLLLFIGRDDHNKRLDFLQRQESFIASLGMKLLVVTNKCHPDTQTTTYVTDVSDGFIKDAMRRAIAVVIPSKYEAFSLVASDALNYKTAVLASDRVAVREYLEHEWFFRTFQYDSIPSFQQELPKLLREIEANRDFKVPIQVRELSWSNIARRVSELYGVVLGEPTRHSAPN